MNNDNDPYLQALHAAHDSAAYLAEALDTLYLAAPSKKTKQAIYVEFVAQRGVARRDPRSTLTS